MWFCLRCLLYVGGTGVVFHLLLIVFALFRAYYISCLL